MIPWLRGFSITELGVPVKWKSTNTLLKLSLTGYTKYTTHHRKSLVIHYTFFHSDAGHCENGELPYKWHHHLIKCQVYLITWTPGIGFHCELRGQANTVFGVWGEDSSRRSRRRLYGSCLWDMQTAIMQLPLIMQFAFDRRHIVEVLLGTWSVILYGEHICCRRESFLCWSVFDYQEYNQGSPLAWVPLNKRYSSVTCTT